VPSGRPYLNPSQRCLITQFDQFRREILTHLESDQIFARAWKGDILKMNADHREFIQRFNSAEGYREKIDIVLSFKTSQLITSLKRMEIALSGDRITQSMVRAAFQPLRNEVSSSFFPGLSFVLLDLCSDLLIMAKDSFTASEVCKSGLILADIFNNWKQFIRFAERLGKCLRDRRLYSEAVECFRNMLAASWIVGDMRSELTAFDHLGMAYFYMDKPEMANLYHSKAVTADSEMSNRVILSAVQNKQAQDRRRKNEFLRVKDSFFLQSLMQSILQDPSYLQDQTNMTYITPLLSTISSFDDNSVKRPPTILKEDTHRAPLSFAPNSEVNHRIRLAREKQYTLNFTPEGLMHSLALSNPGKHFLLRHKMIEMGDELLKDVSLKEHPRQGTSVMLLTHQSQNKSAESYVSYHNFRGSDADICLEFITPDIKKKIRKKIDETVVELEILILH